MAKEQTVKDAQIARDREKAFVALSALSNEDRLEVFALFCTHCGDGDPRCQCWNGE